MTTDKRNMGLFSDFEKIQREALGLRSNLLDFGGLKFGELWSLKEVIFISQGNDSSKRKWELGRVPKLVPLDIDPHTAMYSYSWIQDVWKRRPTPKIGFYGFEKAPGDKWHFKGKDLQF
ncbi:uncharacterized protein PAC_07844 [Phialocephala subalpina]|uniref:Uncharacterized protein n=1 Tax=Phialocephala subalpina TaxID=576137 RepID=A0A1L7WYV9_9HELO|nr:uncharacterized protein PAC_07844 [Phialocephala subalpina]